MRTSLLLVVLALCGCSDEERAPLSPTGGGSRPVDIMRSDAGHSDDEDDAGMRPDAATDTPLANECVRVDALHYTSDDVPTVTGTSSPADFLVTRQAATWRDGCESPTLVVELSNGICPNGQGHELEIMFSALAIEDGQIGLGLNLIDAEKDFGAIRVRYTRPERFAPSGVWGTCEGASGQISFYDVPEASRATNLIARYELMLTACDGSTGRAAQMVSGYFDVRVRRGLPTVCPK